jgi:hypothetical protein
MGVVVWSVFVIGLRKCKVCKCKENKGKFRNVLIDSVVLRFWPLNLLFLLFQSEKMKI